MPRKLSSNRVLLFVLALLMLTGASSMVIVEEGEQVVIERWGEPIRVVNRFRSDGASGAGVVLKLPFAEQAIRLDRGLRGATVVGQAVRTLDAQQLLVDADVTYRIIDPVRLVNRIGSQADFDAQLVKMLPAVLREPFALRDAQALAMPGSGGAAKAALASLDALTRSYGVQVVDFRLGRVMPDEAGVALAYQRMQERHLNEASAIADASSLEARQIMADTNAETARMMQDVAGKDPEFYGFFRAMRSYDMMLADPSRKDAATIVIPPDSAYLRHFNGR